MMQVDAQENPALYRTLSPQEHVQTALWHSAVQVPWLGVVGSLDDFVSAEATSVFYEGLAARNECCAFTIIPGAHHGFCGMPSLRVLAVCDAAVGLMDAVGACTA